jgi:hypothetical protein
VNCVQCMCIQGAIRLWSPTVWPTPFFPKRTQTGQPSRLERPLDRIEIPVVRRPWLFLLLPDMITPSLRQQDARGGWWDKKKKSPISSCHVSSILVGGISNSVHSFALIALFIRVWQDYNLTGVSIPVDGAREPFIVYVPLLFHFPPTDYALWPHFRI